jgi:hypothetical protein
VIEEDVRGRNKSGHGDATGTKVVATTGRDPDRVYQNFPGQRRSDVRSRDETTAFNENRDESFRLTRNKAVGDDRPY